MFNFTITNSAGNSKQDSFEPGYTVADIISMPQYSGIINGQNVMLNGSMLTQAEHHMTLSELGCSPEHMNTLMAVKPANGAAA